MCQSVQNTLSPPTYSVVYTVQPLRCWDGFLPLKQRLTLVSNLILALCRQRCFWKLASSFQLIRLKIGNSQIYWSLRCAYSTAHSEAGKVTNFICETDTCLDKLYWVPVVLVTYNWLLLGTWPFPFVMQVYLKRKPALANINLKMDCQNCVKVRSSSVEILDKFSKDCWVPSKNWL